MLQEVALPSTAEPAKFLEAAVEFANDRYSLKPLRIFSFSFPHIECGEGAYAAACGRCWGSLSCTVISPPETDAQSLDKAVAGLRYGSVNVNVPSFVGYSFPKLSWGAFPGNTLQVGQPRLLSSF